MSEHYDFHYQPTGSGAISGQQVLEQTEDAINELGDYVNDNVGGAMDVAQQALETAQNAEQDAQTALDTANSFSSAIQSAQQDASTALSTAQTAQTTASNANNTAIQAQQDASSAVTTANNASGQVSTLSGTVTALGQRVTTAEGNIGQNTSDITALTTRVGTAEGNITTLQNDVTIAQGNASSAMATAGQVKQQAFVFRYSSTVLVASSTNSNALLDNADNLKVGDKVIDSSGVLFSITAIDTANSTFTVGTALIDLAQDSDVVHKSGDETIGGVKAFANNRMVVGRNTDNVSVVQFVNSDVVGDSANGTSSFEVYGSSISDANKIGSITIGEFSNNGGSYALIECNRTASGVKSSNVIRSLIRSDGTKELTTTVDNDCRLGSPFLRWSKIYGTEYYYGSNNVEFSTKFVTTDTAQTISETKTFTNTIKIKKEIELTGSRLAYILPEFSASYSGLSLCTYDASGAVKIGTWKVDDNDNTKHKLDASLGYLNVSTGSSNSVNIVYLTPKNASIAKLGDSVNKWHEINGVEPSSLSMPVFPSQSSWIDISSYITDMTGAVANLYTPPANGYITFSATGNQVQIFSDYGLQSKFSIQSGSTIRGYHPVLKNEPIKIYMIGTSIEFFRFIPCQGNV